MQTPFQRSDLTVAILMDDYVSAKEIASSLRHYNILAHHYQNLDEFWASTHLQTPHLTIIDVTKMSQGTVKLRSHPRVQDETLCYAFYSKESTKILLQSTLGMKAYGYLNDDVTLSSQIQILVDRRVQDINAQNEKNIFEQRFQRLQNKSQRIITDRSNAEEFKSYFDFIGKFCKSIETGASVHDFMLALMHNLENWQAISGYGIFEISQNGQRLSSPEYAKKKFHPFPSLWLGQSNLSGIEPFAVEMASQVAHDLFESEPRLIQISGSHLPELLLYVSLSDQHMENFPWEFLESSLSASLRKVKLIQQLPQFSNQFYPMWDALDLMDKMQIDRLTSQTKVVGLSLIPLVHFISRKNNNKFYWASFFNDFFLQLAGRMQKSTKLSLLGPWQVLFFISQEDLEQETLLLGQFIKKFNYWKFFEDNSQIMPDEMIPELKLLPPSSVHFLRIFEKEFENLSFQSSEQKVLLKTADNKRISI